MLKYYSTLFLINGLIHLVNVIFSIEITGSIEISFKIFLYQKYINQAFKKQYYYKLNKLEKNI